MYYSLKKTKLGKSMIIAGLAVKLTPACYIESRHIWWAFMKTSSTPILKNRNGDNSNENIFRPIFAIVTSMLKTN